MTEACYEIIIWAMIKNWLVFHFTARSQNYEFDIWVFFENLLRKLKFN
jgi:hypothetical protein